MTELTQAYLKAILNYDPDTGEFVWKHRPDARVQWNGRFAGEVAGSFDKSNGYRVLRINCKKYWAHRLAWFFMTAEWPREIDHKNLIRSDNSWGNLRFATSHQNMANTPRRCDNTSGFKGVHFCKKTARWKAEIWVKYHHLRLGSFVSKDEAASAYAAAANKYFGEFARME